MAAKQYNSVAELRDLPAEVVHYLRGQLEQFDDYFGPELVQEYLGPVLHTMQADIDAQRKEKETAYRRRIQLKLSSSKADRAHEMRRVARLPRKKQTRTTEARRKKRR